MSRTTRTAISKPALIVAAAALAGVLALTSCSSSSKSVNTSSTTNASGAGATTTPSAATLTIQQLGNMAGQVGKVIDAFKQTHPNVKVNVQTITADQFTSNLEVLTSADPPDIGFVPLNSQTYSQLLKAKGLIPLDDVWQKADLRKRYGADLANAISGGSTPYLVGFDSLFYDVVLYNKDLFSKLQIAEPTNHRFSSFDEFASAASTLKKAGYAGIAVGGNNGYKLSGMLDGLLPTATTKDQMTNYLTSWLPSVSVTAQYTDPEFVSALAALKSYQSTFQNGFLGMDDDPAGAVFAAGKAGMALGTSQSFSSLRKSATFQPGWALLPPVNPGATAQLTAFAADALAIPVKAKNPALAKEFLELYLSDDMQQNGVLAGGNNLPIVNSLPASAFTSLDPEVQAMFADEAANGSQSGWTNTVPGKLGQALVNPLIQAMLQGQTDPASIAAKVQAQLSVVRQGN